MKFFRKWIDRIVGSDDDLEMADRRLFLQGLAVASSGLIVPAAIVSVPEPICVAMGTTLWVTGGVRGNELADPVAPTFDSVVAALKFANARRLYAPQIVLTPGYHEVHADDFGAWPEMPKGAVIRGGGSGAPSALWQSRKA